jgi:hypothetical protein
MDEFMKASANARVLDPVDSVTSIIIFVKNCSVSTEENN